jgi:membrane associated rhomboid family serine protease
MNQYRPILNQIPPVVKNLIIVNVLMLLATYVLKNMGINLDDYLALHYPASDKFMPHQIFTHMFMHGNLAHLFFNMFALWMFGRILESVWGPKRFLFFYLVTGVGAAAFYTFINFLEFQHIASQMSPEAVQTVLNEGQRIYSQGQNYTDDLAGRLNLILNAPMVGASGAIFGVLLAFGMLFPNTQLMLLIPPIPIKAKYFVMGYGAIELYLGLTQPGSNIAHFAHLGGMLFGFFLIRYWNKTNKNFY